MFYLDSPHKSNHFFQSAGAERMAWLTNFSSILFCLCIFIVFFVITIAIRIIYSSYLNYLFFNFNEYIELEFYWTLIPMLVLSFVGLYSIPLLYKLDGIYHPEFTIKAIGHQWYWEYETNDFKENSEIISYNSYMITSDELSYGGKRYLEVDYPLWINRNTEYRLIVNSSDVIHSWALPAFGIKIDAVPGKLSQINLNTLRQGFYYGQCSEICGSGHAFMPICVEVI